MDIDGWLRGIGLEQYAEMFRANDIDVKLLGRLTNDDLKDIGVASFGHRKKLLEAIAELGSAPAPPPAVPAGIRRPQLRLRHHQPLPRSKPPASAGIVTVMFCDLVDSTGISAQLDAEEWRDLVGAYLDAASAAVTEMGGQVAKKLGDGLMALFGYPVAQENDAERAVRAALAIQRALAELNRKNAGTGKPALAARIGDRNRAGGGRCGRRDFRRRRRTSRRGRRRWPSRARSWSRRGCSARSPVCSSPRSAARHELKGVPEPVTLFRLVRASGGGRRAGQRHLTPLVGRDEEIAMLMRRWERARQGDGQLVTDRRRAGVG